MSTSRPSPPKDVAVVMIVTGAALLAGLWFVVAKRDHPAALEKRLGGAVRAHEIRPAIATGAGAPHRDPSRLVDVEETAVAVAVSPDHQLVAVVLGARDKISFWDFASGAKRGEIAIAGVNAVAFTPDGARVFLGSDHAPSRPRFASVARLEIEPEQPGCATEDGVVAALSADGRRVVTGKRGLCLFDVASGEELGHFEACPSSGDERDVGPVAISRDGSRVAAVCASDIAVFDAASGRELDRFPIDEGGIRGNVAFSPDAKGLFLALQRGTIAILHFDLAGHTMLAPIRLSANEPPRHRAVGFQPKLMAPSFALSPDGKRLLVGTFEGSALWDVASGEVVSTSLSHAPALALALSPDGKAAVLASGPVFAGVRHPPEITVWTGDSNGLTKVDYHL